MHSLPNNVNIISISSVVNRLRNCSQYCRNIRITFGEITIFIGRLSKINEILDMTASRRRNRYALLSIRALRPTVLCLAWQDFI